MGKQSSNSRSKAAKKSAAKGSDTRRAKNGGSYFSPEALERMREANKGKKFSKEHRENISKARLKAKFRHTDEARKQMSESRKGRTHSPEAIEKMRKAAKKRAAKETPELKAQRLRNYQKTWSKRTSEQEAQRRERIAEKTSGDMLERLGQERYDEVIKKRGKGYRKWWNSLSEEEKVEWGIESSRRVSKSHIRQATTSQGTEINVHSGWEAHVYDALERIGLRFEYANDEGVNNTLNLKDRSWTPDFFIRGKGGLILEVKGDYGRMWEQFNTVLRSFRKSQYASSHSIFVIAKDISKHLDDIHSWSDLKQHGTFMHVAKKHEHKWKASKPKVGRPKKRK